MEREDGYPLLKKIIRQKYRKATLATADAMLDFMITVMTNKNFGDLIPFFERRQTKEQRVQQLAITTSTLSSLGQRLMRRFVKSARISGIFKKIQVEGNDTATQKLEELANSFYENKPVENYMLKYVNNLSLIDANAFLCIHWKKFPKGGQPIVYPVIWSCKQVQEFQYNEQGLLSLLMIKQANTFTLETGEVKSVTDYILYENGRQTAFLEMAKGRVLDKGFVLVEIEQMIGVDGTALKFAQYEYDTKLDEVPAHRLGYIPDIEDVELRVSPIFAAEPHFRDYIKLKSQIDLTTLIHVYARLFQYVEKCPGEGGGRTCNKGKVAAVNPPVDCQRCKGKGIITQDNAMDVLYMPIPDDIKEMFPLDKIAHYLTPDLKVMDSLREMLYEVEYQKVPITVFGTEVLIRSNGSKVADSTATENLLSADQLNDTLRPFVENVSDWYKFIVRITGKVNDFKKINVMYEYPADLAVETAGELLTQLKTAIDSGANSQMLEILSNKAMLSILRDKPKELNKYEVQTRFLPLNGRSESERVFLMGTGLIPKDLQILFTNFDSIIDEIDFEQQNEKKDFYAMSYIEQEKLIDAKVKDYKALIEAENPKPVLNINGLPASGADPKESENPADPKLIQAVEEQPQPVPVKAGA